MKMAQIQFVSVIFVLGSFLTGSVQAYISISTVLPNATVTYSNCMLHDLKNMRNQTFDPSGLIITHCYIPELPNAFFIRLKNLTLLEIVESKLLTIGDFALNGMPGLKSLSLIKNNISEVKSWSADDMKNLTNLDLRRNQIKAIGTKDFRRFPNLQKLNLAVNFITDLEPSLFSYIPNLKYLNLGRNTIKSVNAFAFRGLSKLTQLALHHNQLENIDKNAFLTNANLRSLRLEGNRLAAIDPVLIQSIPRLAHLNLSHNSLEELEDGTFNKSVELKGLDLSHNKFENITLNMFSGLQVLEMLNFSANSIHHIHPLAFTNLNHMIYFDLSLNNLVALPSGIFEYFRQVESMNLSRNELSDIHWNVFQQMEALLILDLSLNNLHTDSFLHRLMPSTQYLDLSNNLFRAMNLSKVHSGRINLIGNPWDCQWLVSQMANAPETVQFGSNYTVDTKGQMLDVLGVDCYQDMALRSIILMKSAKCAGSAHMDNATNTPQTTRHRLLHLRLSHNSFDQKAVLLWLFAAVSIVFLAVQGGRKVLKRSEMKSEQLRQMNHERVINELEGLYERPQSKNLR